MYTCLYCKYGTLSADPVDKTHSLNGLKAKQLIWKNNTITPQKLLPFKFFYHLNCVSGQVSMCPIAERQP